MPPFKDEHILILAPGSQTTLAQLGLPESFTPARFRFPTRMFPAEKKGEWEPYKVREKIVTVKTTKPAPDANGAGSQATTEHGADGKEDAEMKDAGEAVPGETAPKPEDAQDDAIEVEEEQAMYEEDPTSDEGAVYPIFNGEIVDWPCFFALLTHIYNTLSPPFHTPIMLISQPVWTVRDREVITQFMFEKFKTPAFCMMDSALAVCYAYGTANATVVDVGYGKADVTAVTDFVVNDHGRGLAIRGCGGEAMTDRLLELLRTKGFTRDMCEQLKKSNICEILPAVAPLPGGSISASELPNAASENASTAGHRDQEPLKSGPDSVPGRGPGMNKNMGNGEEDDEGVLDVATIVSGNTSEYLARREKEKAERTAAKKNNGGDAAGGKPVRLPNSKKEKASFQFQEFVKVEPESGSTTGPSQFVQQKRDIEVGIERFLCTTPSEAKPKEGGGYSILDTLAAQIHHTILAVPDATKRSELWDSLIILGNGSKIKGFPQALLHTISQKYVLSPSSGTIFTSELPSAFSTPLPTGGTNTPNPQNSGSAYNPAAHGVNPLLVAATHSNNPATPNHLNPNLGITDPNSIHHHHRSTGHSQTPTSVKQLKPPEYFPEWKSQGGGAANANSSGGVSSTTNGQGGLGASNSAAQNGPGTGSASGSLNVGMEEATFLGAQVAAKVVFVIDQGLSKGFLSRVDYNEVGPTAIHDCAL